MKSCRKCNVTVESPVKQCPLCDAWLTPLNNQPEIAAYPDLHEQTRKNQLAFRISLAVSLCVSIVCLTIDLLTEGERPWSMIVIANIVYIWVAIGTALRERARTGYIVFMQALSLAALIFVINRLIGHMDWALDYALPLCFITGTLSITIITIVRRMRHREFILYFILTALLGFIPLVFLALNLLTVSWPAIVSAIYSGLSLIGIFVFADNSTKTELRKRFHF